MLKIQKTVPALLAGAFLLPAFTAQAQVATTTSLTSSENPSHVSDSVTFSNGVLERRRRPDGECPIY